MNHYLLTDPAKADLRLIWKWIAADNRDAATRLKRDILEACAMLALHPEPGGLQSTWTTRPVRFYVVRKNYWIVYNYEAKPLHILRIIHAARDISVVLAKEC